MAKPKIYDYLLLVYNTSNSKVSYIREKREQGQNLKYWKNTTFFL